MLWCKTIRKSSNKLTFWLQYWSFLFHLYFKQIIQPLGYPLQRNRSRYTEIMCWQTIASSFRPRFYECSYITANTWIFTSILQRICYVLLLICNQSTKQGTMPVLSWSILLPSAKPAKTRIILTSLSCLIQTYIILRTRVLFRSL